MFPISPERKKWLGVKTLTEGEIFKARNLQRCSKIKSLEPHHLHCIVPDTSSLFPRTLPKLKADWRSALEFLTVFPVSIFPFEPVRRGFVMCYCFALPWAWKDKTYWKPIAGTTAPWGLAGPWDAAWPVSATQRWLIWHFSLWTWVIRPRSEPGIAVELEWQPRPLSSAQLRWLTRFWREIKANSHHLWESWPAHPGVFVPFLQHYLFKIALCQIPLCYGCVSHPFNLKEVRQSFSTKYAFFFWGGWDGVGDGAVLRSWCSGSQ